MAFVKATRSKSKLKMCIAGASGSGKSFTALRFAFAMVARGLAKRVAVTESEAGKINKYAGYIVDGQKWDFDVDVLKNFSPADYVASLEAAASAGFDLVIVDSISHEWQGKGGALEMVDRMDDKNKFAGWKTVTPMHNVFVDTVLRLPIHVIATCRSKMDYVLEDVTTKDGRTVKQPRKIGLGPIQRGGIEYEFEIFCEMDQSHILTVSKTICPLIDKKVVAEPDAAFFEPVIRWLDEGVEITADKTFQSSLVSPAVAGELVSSLINGGVDITREIEWIKTKFGATEWTHLTPTQFSLYRERAAYLIDQATKLAEQINGTASTPTAPSSTSSVSTTPSHSLATDGPATDGPMDVSTTDTAASASAGAAGQATNGQGHDAPTSTSPAATTPTQYVRPSVLGPDVDGGLLQMWSELGHLLSWTNAQSTDILAQTCMTRGGVNDVRKLPDDKKSEFERDLVGKLVAIYQERGLHEAARPYMTA